MKLVLATRNSGKIREISGMLEGQNEIELLSLHNYPDAPDVVEDGITYEENAIKKASTLANYTGHSTIADDSGLEVDALDGAPGVHSHAMPVRTHQIKTALPNYLVRFRTFLMTNDQHVSFVSWPLLSPYLSQRLFGVSAKDTLVTCHVEKQVLDTIQFLSLWVMTKPLRNWEATLRIRSATVRKRWVWRERY